LTYICPQTDNNDVSTSYLGRAELKAAIVPVHDGVTRARLGGSLWLKHRLYPHRNDNLFAQATVLGYVEFDVKPNRARTLQLVRDRATYGREGFRAPDPLYRAPGSRDSEGDASWVMRWWQRDKAFRATGRWA
jgi:hypothetical protein